MYNILPIKTKPGFEFLLDRFKKVSKSVNKTDFPYLKESVVRKIKNFYTPQNLSKVFAIMNPYSFYIFRWGDERPERWLYRFISEGPIDNSLTIDNDRLVKSKTDWFKIPFDTEIGIEKSRVLKTTSNGIGFMFLINNPEQLVDKPKNVDVKKALDVVKSFKSRTKQIENSKVYEVSKLIMSIYLPSSILELDMTRDFADIVKKAKRVLNESKLDTDVDYIALIFPASITEVANIILEYIDEFEQMEIFVNRFTNIETRYVDSVKEAADMLKKLGMNVKFAKEGKILEKFRLNSLLYLNVSKNDDKAVFEKLVSEFMADTDYVANIMPGNEKVMILIKTRNIPL